jgi:hypothetical protein
MKKILMVLGALMTVLLIFSFASACGGSDIAVEGKANQGTYFTPIGIVPIQSEYCVYTVIKNTSNSPIKIDTVEAIFDAGGKGLRQTVLNLENPGWTLAPNKAKTFEFCTDGWTYDILMAAREKNISNILFHLIIYTGGNQIEYIAPVPSLENLPERDLSKKEPTTGYPLKFKRL